MDAHPKKTAGRKISWVAWSLIVVSLVALLGCLAWAEHRGKHAGQRVQCLSNLKQIYCLAISWSEKYGGGYWPPGNAPSASAASALNVMLPKQDGISPRLFVCPESDDSSADQDPDGRFQLAADNLSYAWTATPLRSTAIGKPLAACRHLHLGFLDNGSGENFWGVNVLWSDGSVSTEPLESMDPVTHLPPGLVR